MNMFDASGIALVVLQSWDEDRRSGLSGSGTANAASREAGKGPVGVENPIPLIWCNTVLDTTKKWLENDIDPILNQVSYRFLTLGDWDYSDLQWFTS